MRHAKVLSDEQIPPAYPRHLESTAVLEDGRQVWIRPIAPCDHAGLSWEIANADGETLYLRFFTRAIRDRPDFVATLVDLDYEDELALTAIGEHGEGAGVARFVRTDVREEAQLAIVVGPGWRNVGLATKLLELIQRAAWERGVRRMTAVYLAENDVVDSMRRAQGIPDPVVRHGLAEINWDLAGPSSAVSG